MLRSGSLLTKEIDLDELWEEISAEAPLLSAALKSSAMSLRHREVDREMKLSLCMCAAILMRQRSKRHLNHFQNCLGLLLFDGHASKKVRTSCMMYMHAKIINVLPKLCNYF